MPHTTTIAICKNKYTVQILQILVVHFICTYLVSPRHTYILPSGLWCSHLWNCRWSPARDSKANFCQKPECNQNIKILMSDYTAQLFKGKAVSHEDKRDFVIERKPDFLRGRCCGSYLWNSLRGAVSYPEKKWLWQSSRIVPWYLTTTFYEHQKILQLFETTWAHIKKISKKALTNWWIFWLFEITWAHIQQNIL